MGLFFSFYFLYIFVSNVLFIERPICQMTFIPRAASYYLFEYLEGEIDGWTAACIYEGEGARENCL